MCGIFATYVWSTTPIETSALVAGARAQQHRGPDGHGYAAWDRFGDIHPTSLWRGPVSDAPQLHAQPVRVGLAHNWLAIQDDNSAAAQPFSTRDSQYWIVFNGEIYNFAELRSIIGYEDEPFFTNSDTEVLLRLWRKFGPTALSRLRGMFAFALYEPERSTLWVARDRFGIKPLYYARFGNDAGVIVSSEIRAIHASGLLHRSLDEQAVRSFLAAGITKPSQDGTFYSGIHELEPGHFLEIRPRSLVKSQYYRLPDPQSDLGLHDLPELRASLIDTVRSHLSGRREVALSLSGGLDSTSIANAAALAGRGDLRLKAYSFGRADEEEIQLASIVSSELALEHHRIDPPASVLMTDLIEVATALETPSHCWGPVNSLLLLREVKQQGIAVLLNGQGGDEVLSGYPWFLPVLDRAIAARDPALARRLRENYSAHPGLLLDLQKRTESMYSSPQSWVRTISAGALEVLGVTEDEVLSWEPVRYYLNQEREWPEFRRSLIYRRDLPHLLRQEDRLGMWFSIEIRVPFLDHILAELCGRFSPETLIADGYLKAPLRRLFPERSEAVRWNVAKRGFWENRSALPANFGWLAALASAAAPSLGIQDPACLLDLEPIVSWRFLQIALMSQTSDYASARMWLSDLDRSCVAASASVAESMNQKV